VVTGPVDAFIISANIAIIAVELAKTIEARRIIEVGVSAAIVVQRIRTSRISWRAFCLTWIDLRVRVVTVSPCPYQAHTIYVSIHVRILVDRMNAA
jgi:hypothetical protein